MAVKCERYRKGHDSHYILPTVYITRKRYSVGLADSAARGIVAR